MDNIKHNSSTLLANIIYQKKKKKNGRNKRSYSTGTATKSHYPIFGIKLLLGKDDVL